MHATMLLQVAATHSVMAVLAHAITVKGYYRLGSKVFWSQDFLKLKIINYMHSQFKKVIKRYKGFLFLFFIILGLLLLLLYDGDLQNTSQDSSAVKWIWNHEVLSALLGAATVATITYVLLKGQESNENAVEQKKRVFENKLKSYESFLTTLEEVVISSNVTPENEKRLQFGVAKIGMHSKSKDMLIISKSLKGIIRKIKYEERVDASIWNELMQIVNIFQQSLYLDESYEIDKDLRKAIRNFSNLSVERENKDLEKVECMLLSYHFNSFISDKWLFYDIPIKRRVSVKYGLPDNVFVTLEFDNGKENHKHTGRIAIYLKNDAKNNIDIIYNEKNGLWVEPENSKLNKLKPVENIELGVNIIKYARVMCFKKPIEVMEIQSILGDLINFMHPVWAEKGETFLRKNKYGKVYRETPSEKKIEEVLSIKEETHDTRTT